MHMRGLQCYWYTGKRAHAASGKHRTCAVDVAEESISTLCVLGCPKVSFEEKRALSFELNGLVSSSCERLAFPALLSRFTLEFVSICERSGG